MVGFTKHPGGHRVTDPDGGGCDYKEEPGMGWKKLMIQVALVEVRYLLIQEQGV